MISTRKPQKGGAHLIFLAEDLMQCFMFEKLNKYVYYTIHPGERGFCYSCEKQLYLSEYVYILR